MSKGLEALKRIRQETCPATYMADFDKNQCCDDIEKELKRLEKIENAKPTKALECLENYKKHSRICGIGYDVYDKWFDTIKQALLKAQEQEKVLDVIKEKNVDIALLKECKNVHEYNIEVTSHNENLIKPLEWWTRKHLTQEEFELLKRWLEKCQK